MKQSWSNLEIGETTLVIPELQMGQHVKCRNNKMKEFCKRKLSKSLTLKVQRKIKAVARAGVGGNCERNLHEHKCVKFVKKIIVLN